MEVLSGLVQPQAAVNPAKVHYTHTLTHTHTHTGPMTRVLTVNLTDSAPLREYNQLY